MSKIRSFAEANRALERYISQPGVSKHAYTLERITELMAFLGNPQDAVPVIHIAGTSGKTSTAYYCTALLRAAGHKVGLTVSPHVDEVNERVQVNLQPLPEKAFCKALGEFLELVEQSRLEPTYFEVLVAFAYWEFARRKVDYAVVEVGLGGLLDGTNTVTRPDKICVITDIGLDHTEVLGSTIEEIATQKAGIIHEQNQVFMNRQTVAAAKVVEQICYQRGARLHLPPVVEKRIPVHLPLYQQRNFGLALLATEFVLARDFQAVVGKKQIAEAAAVRIPARLEKLSRHGRVVVLDGAHNGQKMHALVESLRAEFPGKTFAVLLSFAEGNPERIPASVQELLPIAGRIIITAFPRAQDLAKRSAAPEDVALACERAGFGGDVAIIEQPEKAVKALLRSPEDVLLVTGSFYLLHAVRLELERS